MPKLAKRMDSFTPSTIVEIAQKAQALKAAGKDIISLSIGVPDFLAPQHVFDAAQQAVANHTGSNYLNSCGTDELRAAFCARLKADGFEYNADEVAATVGAKNALFTLFMMMLDKGDEVIFPAPYWASYTGIVEFCGGVGVGVHCPAEQDYKMTAAQLEAAITPQTKAFLFNNPNNPTGMVYTENEVKALAEVLAKHLDVWILSDDIYDKLIYDGQKFHHLLHSHPELRERTFILQSVSKTYAMPGWRIGMVAGPKAMIKKVGQVNGQTMMNVPGVSMAAAAAAFSGDHSFLNEVRESFTRKRDLTMAALNKMAGVKCPFPSGAFYAFPDISALYGRKFEGVELRDDVHFCELMLENFGVALVPGGAFGEPKSVRISFACDDDELQAGLDKIASLVAALK